MVDKIKGTTLGARSFGAFLRGDNPTGQVIPVRRAAAVLGVSATMVCRYRDGTDSPPPPIRKAIKTWSHGRILLGWWRTAAEHEQWQRAQLVRPIGTVAA